MASLSLRPYFAPNRLSVLRIMTMDAKQKQLSGSSTDEEESDILDEDEERQRQRKFEAVKAELRRASSAGTKSIEMKVTEDSLGHFNALLNM